MESMTAEEVRKWLPHREPFLFVDQVDKVDPGKSAETIKSFPEDWSFLRGHFPGNPVVPGVVVVEALGQLACVLGFKTIGGYEGHNVYLMGLDKARFRKIIRPGDKILLQTEIKRQGHNFWRFGCKASVDGDAAVEVDIRAYIEEPKGSN